MSSTLALMMTVVMMVTVTDDDDHLSHCDNDTMMAITTDIQAHKGK